MTDCGVCIGEGDYEPWEFYSETIIKSRKLRQCCECGRGILAGSMYERIAGKVCGDFQTYDTCLDCMNIRRGLACDGSLGLTMLWEEIGCIFKEVTTGCLTKIRTPSAKAYFLERWRKWKGLEA